MLLDVHTLYLVGDQHHQERLAKVAQRRLMVEVACRADGARRWTSAVSTPVRVVISALGRLAALAYDGRGNLRSKDEGLAALGVTWTTDLAHVKELATELQAVAARRAVASPRYPTLDAIDRAREGSRPRFAVAANAADLERRACELTHQYWSESAWLTGRVPPVAFARVCTVLESERIAAAEPATPVVIAAIAGESVYPAAA